MEQSDDRVPLLVAFEARFQSPLPQQALQAVLETLKSRLEKAFPVVDDSRLTSTTRVEIRGADLSNSTRTATISIRPTLVRLELGDYAGHETLRELAVEILLAVQAAGVVDGVERVGLRHLEELSHPRGGRNILDWQEEIDSHLLAPMMSLPPGFLPRRYSGRLQFTLADNHLLNFSYGALPYPTLRVSPARLRTTRRRSPGGVFMLDVDSFCLMDHSNGGPLSVKQLLETDLPDVLDELMAPIEVLINWCLGKEYQHLPFAESRAGGRNQQALFGYSVAGSGMPSSREVSPHSPALNEEEAEEARQ